MDYWHHHRSSGYASVYHLGIGGFTDSPKLIIFLRLSPSCPEEWWKNYLEYLFRKPKFLITSVFAVNGVLLGTCSAMLSPCLVSNSTSAWAAGNSLVFGEYILLAANIEPTRWTLRLVGFACITFAFLIHGVALRWGLCLQEFSRSWYSFSS